MQAIAKDEQLQAHQQHFRQTLLVFVFVFSQAKQRK